MSDSDNEVQPGPSGYARKRTKNIELWKDSFKKMKRNTGQTFTSYKSGKDVAARAIGPPCSCGCFTKIGIDKIQILFDNFWKTFLYIITKLFKK